MNQTRIFKNILLSAIFTVKKKKGELARALLFPLIIYIPLNFVEFPEEELGYTYLANTVNVLLGILIAIIVHRVVLLGSESVQKGELILWSKRVTRFSIYFIGIAIFSASTAALFSAPFLIFTQDEHYVDLIKLIATSTIFNWIWSRFALVFPATAIDEETSLKQSWDLTNKHQVLMYLVISVFLILPPSVNYFLPYTPLISFLTCLAYMVLEILMVTTLSIAYKYFTDENTHDVFEQK